MIEKKELLNHLVGIYSQKIDSLTKDINELNHSKKTDTKSSAGDKFETGREMMQIELNKLNEQLDINHKILKDLQNISIEKKHDFVKYGSYVITNHGSYFIAVGLGSLTFNGNIFFIISLASPIGKLLKDKQVGKKIKFRDKTIELKEIY